MATDDHACDKGYKSCIECHKVWRRRHNAKYYKQNSEKIKKQNNSWYHANKEKAADASRRRYLRNPEAFKQRASSWSKANPEARQTINNRRRHAEGTFTKQDWQEIIRRQQRRCAHCNVQCRLTVDHIVPLVRGGTNWPANLQGLCKSCNSKKGAKLESELRVA